MSKHHNSQPIDLVNQQDFDVLPPKKKKKNAESQRLITASGVKVDLKRSKKIKEWKEQQEAKLTKAKRRELKRIAERKVEKKTRAELLASLQEFQTDTLSGLQPTVEHKPKKYLSDKVEHRFPKRLKGNCKNQKNSAKYDQSGHHYDTGSSCSESDEEVEEDEKFAESDVIAAPESDKTDSELANCSAADFSKSSLPRENIANEAFKSDDHRQKAKSKAEREFLKLLSKIKGNKVVVDRTEEIEQQRSKLPVYSEEQSIVEQINENSVTIISGETGSGKTTQIPQFLYEAGYASNGHLIGITEPRRVAAMSMSERVGKELNNPEISSYQIRFEGNRTEETKILFMTDGVLLKELQSDVKLSKFSVIIIDEAHERSMYSDVLIGLLSRICIQRVKSGVPLKLIVMSATLRLDDFLQSRLFPMTLPRLIKVESRQFPVSIHFEKNTPKDYMKAAYSKICKIHEKLPEGAILVFVSGQKEVHRLVKLLMQRYPKIESEQKQRRSSDDFEIDFHQLEKDEQLLDIDDIGAGDCAATDSENEEEFEAEAAGSAPPKVKTPLYCLPLYSMMPSFMQHRVFDPVPEGHRLCVVATNVAETSLTIPNVRYVVDTGKEKRRDFDPVTGVAQFNVAWCSQASADQRSGRAGRVGAGHTYRLYSSAVFQDFAKFPPPEILHKPVDQLLLHLKSLNIRKISNFPFPTPPETDQLEKAEERLKRLGALAIKNEEEVSSITSLGKTLLLFPLAPHFSKILVMSQQHDVVQFVVTLVSGLSVREPLINVASLEGSDSMETQELMTMLLKQRRKWNNFGQAKRMGDLNVLLRALGAADYGDLNRAGCARVGLRFETLKEIRKMRKQLLRLINASAKIKTQISADPEPNPPTETQLKLIRQMFVACQPEQIARRATGNGIPKGAYQTQHLEELVFIDATSMLYKQEPEYVLYQEITQFTEKKMMQCVTEVEPEWLRNLTGPIRWAEISKTK